MNEKIYFDREKLKVYQESLKFVAWCEVVLQACNSKAAAKDQLDRASTSISLNIAEGNGKYSGRDRCRFLEIARGSAMECAACLDVLVVKKKLTPQEIQFGKELLCNIVSMLVGLIHSVSNRVQEEDVVYHFERE